jgi:hypothetical protein
VSTIAPITAAMVIILKSKQNRGQPLKLNSIAKNQTEVTLSNGDMVFFSYRTPVACYIAKKGRYARTDAWYSSTTTRHINKWLGNLEYDIIPQSYLDEITL